VRLAAIGAWTSLVLALSAWGLLYAGDSWAPATVLLFGPRWLLAVLPLVLLIPAGRAGRWPLAAAIAALLIVVGPVMEFNVPWARATSAPAGGPRLRVLSCNLHFGGNATAVEALVASSQPDVVALQEWREPTGPTAPHWDGWHVDRQPGLTARKSRVQAVRDAIGREPAEGEVYAALPRSEWRTARQL